jgi:hypothetical protein
MTIKAYDGTTWQNQKSLRIYNGSAWSTAKQGWIFNGSSWLITYPEFPLNIASPSISATSGTAGRIGCVYTASVGSWNANDAYSPTSYSYQWTRNGSDISGATGSSYTTVAADSETTIGCRITAINFRGSTPLTISTGITMLPQVTSISVSDFTSTPNTPSSVSISSTGLSYSGSFTTLDNISTYYEALGGGTAGTPSVNSSAKTFSGTGTAGNASVSIRGVNTNRQIYVSWNAAAGAISYDIYINGSYHTNVSPGTNNAYIYSPPDDTARTFTVYPRSTNTQGYGIQYGTAVAATTKYSGYRTSSTIALSEPNATSPTSASSSASTSTLSVSWSGATNATKYRVWYTTSSSFTGDPNVSYDSPEWTGTSASYNGSFSPSQTYYFYISASGANNVWTPYGAYKTSATVPLPLPDTPSGLTATASGQTTINLSWNPSANASSYEIYWYPDSPSTPSAGSTADFAGISGTTYSDTGLSAGTNRYYWVRARNATGTSGWSSPASATTASAPVTTKPTISVSNSWALVSGVDTWTLSMTHTGGSVPTTYNWGIQFSNSSTGPSASSTTGSGNWNAGSGGTQTVVRNSNTYNYARWVSVTASNSAGTSDPKTTTWE